MAAMGEARRRRTSGRGPVIGGMIREPSHERNTAPEHSAGTLRVAVLSLATDLCPPESGTAIVGARPQGHAPQREARDSAGAFRHNTLVGDTPESIAWTLCTPCRVTCPLP